MYNLVIGVIAGAIFGVLAVAGAWYGGAVYERARLWAEHVAVVGQQQQVAAALDLYETDGGRVSSLGDDGAALIGLADGGFLKVVPPRTWRVRRGGEQVWNPLRIQTPEACASMNGLAGFLEVCPPCDSISLKIRRANCRRTSHEEGCCHSRRHRGSLDRCVGPDVRAAVGGHGGNRRHGFGSSGAGDTAARDSGGLCVVCGRGDISGSG
jgi:hypothetical protein